MQLRAMKGAMMSVALSMILALVFLNGWMYLQQPGMIFYPSRVLEAQPTDWGMPYEDVALRTADGVELHGERGAERLALRIGFHATHQDEYT